MTETIHSVPIFDAYEFGQVEKAELDQVGHFVLPGILTRSVRERLTRSLAHISEISPAGEKGHEPGRFAAEFDAYLEGLIAHPDLLDLARRVLGDDIRYDHCVALNRAGGNPGLGWHSHAYGDEKPELGFIRIFFFSDGYKTFYNSSKVTK